ncbi:MAG: TolC family protein [Thermoanaerobaculia bacterium]
MRKTFCRLLFRSALLLFLPALAAGAESPSLVSIPDRLTLDEALRLFRVRGFDLLIAEAAVQSAQGDLISARQIPNPSIQAQGSKAFHYDPTVDGCEGCSSTGFSVGATDGGALFDVVIGKRRLKIRIATAALEAARRSRADAERTLTALVKQQYAQTVMAKVALDFTHETASSTAETFQLIDLRFREGAVSEADSARAETAKLEAEQAVSAAEQTLAAAKASLAFLLGARGGPVPDFAVDESLLKFSVPEIVATTPSADFYQLGSEHRPDLAAALAQVESARAALDLARRQRIPDFQAGAQYAQLGSGQNAIQPPTVTAGLSFALPVFYQQRGEIVKAEAALRAQELTRDKIEAQVVADVGTALSGYAATRQQVERMEGRLLERARKALDLVDLQYRNGAASLLELLDARRTWIATNAEYRQDLTNYWTALFSLEQALGMELHP